MANHPNRSRSGLSPGANPTPDDIRQAREAAGLTQSQAAQLIYSTLRTWQDWEAGARRMHPGLWELWGLKTSHLRRSARVHERLVSLLAPFGGQSLEVSDLHQLRNLPSTPGVYLLSSRSGDGGWQVHYAGPADNLQVKAVLNAKVLVKDLGHEDLRFDFAEIADTETRQRLYGKVRATGIAEVSAR